jgi:hypothetical protein
MPTRLSIPSLLAGCAALMSTLSGGAALAEKTTTRPGFVSKDVYRARLGAPVSHSREIVSFNKTTGSTWTDTNVQQVMLWNGPAQGTKAGKPTGVRMALVPLAGTRDARLKGTKISGDLTQRGHDLVAAHLKAKGLAGTIELGDFMPQSGRLSQHPVSRASGNLRYTVTDASGQKVRYLVAVHPMQMQRGNDRGILGEVFRDKDSYGQDTVRK